MKISIEHYDTKVTIECNNDIDVHELFNHFRSLTIAAGWFEKSFDNAADEYISKIINEKHEENNSSL